MNCSSRARCAFAFAIKRSARSRALSFSAPAAVAIAAMSSISASRRAITSMTGGIGLTSDGHVTAVTGRSFTRGRMCPLSSTGLSTAAHRDQRGVPVTLGPVAGRSPRPILFDRTTPVRDAVAAQGGHVDGRLRRSRVARWVCHATDSGNLGKPQCSQVAAKTGQLCQAPPTTMSVAQGNPACAVHGASPETRHVWAMPGGTSTVRHYIGRTAESLPAEVLHEADRTVADRTRPGVGGAADRWRPR